MRLTKVERKESLALCPALCRHLVYQMSFNPHLGIILTVQVRKLRLRRVCNLCKITAIKARRKIQTHIHAVPTLGYFNLHHVASAVLP